MSDILALADAFAVESSSYKTLKFPTLDDKAQYDKARAALAAEVEKLEQGHIDRLLRIEQNVDVLIAERDALRAELDEARKELNTLDVMLEECKMDWSGDVTQIKAEHKHEVDALREKLATARNTALEDAAKVCDEVLGDNNVSETIRDLKEQK